MANLISARRFLESNGYSPALLSKGPKVVLTTINSLGIDVEKTIPVARGISFLIDEEKANKALANKQSAKSNGGEKSKTLHRQDRSLSRAILHICNELGINLPNHEHIIFIAEKE